MVPDMVWPPTWRVPQMTPPHTVPPPRMVCRSPERGWWIDMMTVVPRAATRAMIRIWVGGEAWLTRHVGGKGCDEEVPGLGLKRTHSHTPRTHHVDRVRTVEARRGLVHEEERR